MIKRIFKLNRVYREAREQAFDETVNALEVGTKPLFFLFFLADLLSKDTESLELF